MATEVSSNTAAGNPQQQQSSSEQQEPPNFDKAEKQPKENQQLTEVVDKQTAAVPVNGGPAHKEEAEKAQSSSSKGLSRFLPGWLKRPKSQISEEECGKETGLASVEDNAIQLQQQLNSVEQKEERGQGAPIADQELDDNIEEEATLDLHSLSSVETQPAQEEKEDLLLEKDSVIKDEVKLETPEEKQGQSTEPQTSEALKPLPKITKKSKTMRCKVTLLDETEFQCDVERHSKGHELFAKVCQHLNLLEKDYFGLAVWDSTNQRSWLDLTKEIKKQLQGGPWDFTFNVKFYPPDPAQLTEDITRYYLCLQLRQDIVTGCLPCSFVTLALLGSYTVQSELGEYDPELHGTNYVSEFRLAPNQTKELEEKIMELHKTHRAMTPAQADLQFLENAKKLSMYGVDFHPAKDLEGVDIMLGVCSGGLLVYKDRLRINRFAWPKVLKISYKRSSFFIKIRPGEDQCESTIGFKLPNYRAAKKLWKVCVENHTFFRLTTPESTAKSKFLSLGSKFRYSGRTQVQTREASALIDRPAPRFERTASKRASRSLDGAKRKFPKTSVELPLDEDLEPRCIEAPREQPAAVTGTPDRSPRAVTTSAPTISQSHSVEASSPPTAETTGVTESKAVKEEVQLEVKQGEGLIEKRSEPVQEVKQVITQQTEIASFPATANEKSQQKPDGEEEVVRMRKKRSKKVEGENIYVRHSNLMLEDLDKTQDEIMKHHASISELKRSFMESVPEPRPSEWDKRLSAHSPFRTLNINGQVQSGTEGNVDDYLKSELDEQSECVKVDHKAEIEALKLENSFSMSQVANPMELPQGWYSIPFSVINSEEEEGLYLFQSKELKWQNRSERGLNMQAEASEEITAKALLSSAAPQLNYRLKEGEHKDQSLKINGDISYYHESPQLIRCFQPPLVKTQTVTISDMPNSENEIATNEVPVVHTETKTITYEAAQTDDGNGDCEPGVLMSAQTITSETVSTTTTTQITKTIKGGISETRIEKRIVITGDSDVDHDQALAQAIKEAKEQHPDMSVTKVVVHQETEVAEE
ncbi:protein 4.1 isoform X10 [Chiloscyllium plagiosum]|uniref:protein 4.1 isoform X10 n=1 Tax=Chiloscyllium plagiosum TaxID=36176 RepID=UPI001CB856FE|nr:protein 4.1 isoform X10 [Chiloscyllium plagiosum]